MLKIVKNKITLTRGDTAYLNVSLLDENGDVFELGEDDNLIFTLKKTTNDMYNLLQKTVSADLSLKLTPDDTKGLEYGSYMYDIQLNRANGDVFTVIAPTQLVIAEEVNFQ